MNKSYAQKVHEHRQSGVQNEDHVIEYRKQWEPLMLNELHLTVHEAKKVESYINQDFYITVKTVWEHLMKVPKFICIARHSCPTPVYSEGVWKYNNNSASLEFLWQIPSQSRYQDVLKNPQKYQNKYWGNIPKFVHLMENGKLLEWVRKENNETGKDIAVIKLDNPNKGVEWKNQK